MSHAGRARAAACAVMACVAGAALAQKPTPPLPGGYPAKPIRVLVGGPPGSGNDVIMRLVAKSLGERWESTVVVDNRPGAVGGIALELAARAAPDGYTLVVVSVSYLTGMLLKTVSVDIPNALAPVVQMTTQSYLLVVTPALPVASVGELIAYAKSKPLAYASSGSGSLVHLGMELFKSMARIDMTHIPYKGSGQSMIDVMSGQVQAVITNSLAAAPHVKSGKLKALAVTSLKRSAAFPELRTVSEAGLPGYELNSWFGLFATAKTPPAIIAALNREIGRIMALPELRDKLAADGAEAAPPHSPAEFQSVMAKDLARWERFIRTTGFRLD